MAHAVRLPQIDHGFHVHSRDVEYVQEADNHIYALGMSLNALMALNSSTEVNVLDADFEISSLASLPKGSNSGSFLPAAAPEEVTTS